MKLWPALPKHPNKTPVNQLGQTVFAFIISICLFLGGIAILALRIPGWSLILGLPSIQIGIVFSIFSFDKIIREKTNLDHMHLVDCIICGLPTPAFKNQNKKQHVCKECLHKINAVKNREKIST